MRLAASSTAFDRALGSGDLSQPELLDLCATELGLDGVVLDRAHFPRRDPDYLAQVKKFAADLGLSIVAVRDDDLAVDSDSDAPAVADSIGAPYVLTRLPAAGSDPTTAYNAALEVLARHLADAKRRNVTIALRNVPGSLAEDALTMTRVRKEADSAWLRFAFDPAGWSEPLDQKIRQFVVLGWRRLDVIPFDGRDPQAEATTAAFGRFVGFLCLDYAGVENEIAAMRRWIDAWRET
ncbi:MAG: TIM barrel protein, partial [Candidatus Eremiobacteraeota bacterium]|nr:TIM barrel protein [Candidatus Eremiobacteraeota bacterium]